MPKYDNLARLAVNGGPKVRQEPWPGRGSVGAEEKAAVDALFDLAIETGNSPGYNGPEEEAYCADFARFLGGNYVDAVSSGTAAIYVALKALEPEPFTEVIVGAVTDPGGIMPIPLLNCIPVVADSEPDRYNVGPKQIKELISPLTSVIVVAHIGGEPADIAAIVSLAKEHGIPVVEDCAQAHGARLNGQLVGTFSEIGAFSTMFGKHYCTGGQGGLVYTSNEELYKRIRQAADRGKPFGLAPGATNCIASLNFNLNDLAAAIGRVQLKKLPEIVAHRRAAVARIAAGIAELETVSIPPQIEGAEATYWFLRMKFHADKASCNKATFIKALQAEGLPCSLNYRSGMPHTMDWFIKRRAFGTGHFPWNSPEYKGDPTRQFPCPNANAAMDSQFNVGIHEGWGEEETADAVAVFAKVDVAYRKQN